MLQREFGVCVCVRLSNAHPRTRDTWGLICKSTDTVFVRTMLYSTVLWMTQHIIHISLIKGSIMYVNVWYYLSKIRSYRRADFGEYTALAFRCRHAYALTITIKTMHCMSANLIFTSHSMSIYQSMLFSRRRYWIARISRVKKYTDISGARREVHSSVHVCVYECLCVWYLKCADTSATSAPHRISTGQSAIGNLKWCFQWK